MAGEIITLGYGGAGAVDLACESFQEGETTYVGGINFSFSGKLQNGIRTKIRNWSLVTIGLDTTTKNNILTLLPLPKVIVCYGEIFENVSINCLVKITDKKPVSLGNTVAGFNWLWQLSMTLTESI